MHIYVQNRDPFFELPILCLAIQKLFFFRSWNSFQDEAFLFNIKRAKGESKYFGK